METRSPFKTVALIGRQNTPGLGESLLKLARSLESRGFTLLFEAATASEIDLSTHLGSLTHRPDVATTREIGARADVAVIVGGDGTMLGVGRELARFNIPLIGVNHGRLGFITDIAIGDMATVVPQLLDGQYEREERSLLEARIVRDGKTIYDALAFNDVVVNRSGFSGMAELRVVVDGRFMYTQRSDGLIVATPTGSTAYALASQGPILHPQVGGIVLVPIAPQSLSNRPIVVPDASEISVQVTGGREVNVNFDMQSFTALALDDTIEIRRSRYTVPFLHPVGYSYYATLRKKLYWNDHPANDPRQN